MWFLHWLSVHTGVNNESSHYYAFWSGIGSDIGEVTLIGAVIATYRKVNCHSKGCWRIAHHELEQDGVTYKLCRKCHPGIDHKNRLRRFHLAKKR